MRIVYFGTPAFSVPFLSALVSKPNVEFIGVVTQPDKPVGRKAVLTAPETKQFALDHHIPVYQFPSLKKEEAFEALKTLQADLFVVFAYGKIIPANVLALPRLGCLNVHPSLLPEYRGPSPMQQAILDGKETTGISIMLLDEGMDTGPILSQIALNMKPNETPESLQQTVVEQGVPLFLQTLDDWAEQKITPKPQAEEGVSVTHLFEKEDGKMNWNNEAMHLERQVRAMKPWPGAWFVWKLDDHETIIKVHEAAVSHTQKDVPGAVFCEDGRVFVSCKAGSLELITIQPEGKQNMSASDFVRGKPLFCSVVLS